MTTRLLMAALVGLALTGPVQAQDRGARHDASMADLTASYNVQQSEVQNLRDKGWSWNDIGSALAISKRSGQPLQELVAQKDSGMSWSQIADKNGFKLSEVQREARQVAKDFRRADAQTRRQAVQGVEGSGTGMGAGETVPGAGGTSGAAPGAEQPSSTPGTGGAGETLPSDPAGTTPTDPTGTPGGSPASPTTTP